MARQEINLGTSAGDGTGTPLRIGGDRINDNFIELYDSKFGVYNYDDATTSTKPISVPSGLGTWTHITNDGSGLLTILGGAYPDVDIYDTSTSLFQFTDLEVFDSVSYRLDTSITTSSINQVVVVRLLLDVGGLNIPLTFIREQYKSVGTFPLFGELRSPILSEAVRTGNARFEISSDGTADLEVNGWLVEVTKRKQG